MALLVQTGTQGLPSVKVAIMTMGPMPLFLGPHGPDSWFLLQPSLLLHARQLKVRGPGCMRRPLRPQTLSHVTRKSRASHVRNSAWDAEPREIRLYPSFQE